MNTLYVQELSLCSSKCYHQALALCLTSSSCLVNIHSLPSSASYLYPAYPLLLICIGLFLSFCYLYIYTSMFNVSCLKMSFLREQRVYLYNVACSVFWMWWVWMCLIPHSLDCGRAEEGSWEDGNKCLAWGTCRLCLLYFRLFLSMDMGLKHVIPITGTHKEGLEQFPILTSLFQKKNYLTFHLEIYYL